MPITVRSLGLSTLEVYVSFVFQQACRFTGSLAQINNLEAFAIRQCDVREEGFSRAGVATPQRLWHPDVCGSQVTSRLGFSLLALKVVHFRGVGRRGVNVLVFSLQLFHSSS